MVNKIWQSQARKPNPNGLGKRVGQRGKAASGGLNFTRKIRRAVAGGLRRNWEKKSGPRKIFLAGVIFLWHASCDTFLVARKFHASGMVRSATDNAAMNLRMATMQLAGLRLPPRVRTVPRLRQRLPVVFVSESALPVKIRHTSQNVGSPISETRPTQNPRV